MAFVSVVQQGEITQLLHAWRDGDPDALARLTPLVYEELKRLARAYMKRERAGHTLQTTALVHEAYVRLLATPRVRWRDRVHFFALSAQLMRRVLVDYSRSRAYLKRGGGMTILPLDQAPEIGKEQTFDLEAIDAALGTLGAIDARKGQVVEMRFFGGLSVEETASALQVSEETVLRDWRFAKSWLLRELSSQKI